MSDQAEFEEVKSKIQCSSQLRIEQYRSLRVEIEQTIKDIRDLELYAVAGIVVYYSWLFTHSIPSITVARAFDRPIQSTSIAWFIPVIVPMLGMWRVWSNVRQLLIAAEYVAKLESEFAAVGLPIGPSKGWENYLQRIRSRRKLWYRLRRKQASSWMTLFRRKRKMWSKMTTHQRILCVGLESYYWQFWILLLFFTAVVFLSMSKSAGIAISSPS